MILSQKQIEEIAAAVTEDFNKFFFGTESEEVRMARATPIDQFARDYLGLQVSFARLSSDGSICGLTAYTDTEYIVEEKGVRRMLPLKCNQVLLDESFIRQGQIKKLCGKRRFTLAHECAHQILYALFKRLKPGAQLIIVGDADQLPSVGAGNVLHELIRCDRIPVAFLDTVFRQASNSRISFARI